MSRGERILVVGPSWVGDMVMAQALYKHLAETRDAPVIDVIAPAWSLDVLARMPEVGRGIELPVEHGELALGRRAALGRALRAARYDQAIVLPRSLKAALVPFFARIPQRTGFRGEWRYGLINDMRPFDAAVLDQTVRRFVALGSRGSDDATLAADAREGKGARPAVPAPALEADRVQLAAARERLGLAPDRDAVALMPGAEYGPAKRWPVERFARLAAQLTAAGVAVWVMGARGETPLGEQIVRAAPEAHNLCGRTSLAEAVDLLSATRAAVTNDSGLMHVAAAVGTHVVAIYGSSSPAFTPPLTDKRTIYYQDLECSPCFERTCPLHHLNCLRGISVRAVFDGTLAALGHAAAQTPAPDAPSPAAERDLADD